MKNKLENLELKLLQTRKDNAEMLDKIENEFKQKYSEFFDVILKNDSLGFKRCINVSYQLKKLDNPDSSNLDILRNSINKALEILPLNKSKKVNLEKKMTQLIEIYFLQEKNKTKENLEVLEVFRKNNDLRKDINFPILQDLEKHGILDDNDILNISLKFKKTHNFLDSISVLGEEKKEIVKLHYYELHSVNKNKKIKHFENDFSTEIKNSKLLQIYPKVLRFVGKNYFRLKLKNKVESKKDKLRRLYKIAFLKLYRLKYSGIDISNILNQIDNLSDFDDFINLIVKYFETLKQNPNLQKDYIVSEDIDEVNNTLDETGVNKQKILFTEKNTIKVTEIFEAYDKKINEDDLEELLGEDIELVGNEFVKREEINVGIYSENNEEEDEKKDDLDGKEIIDIEEYYEELKREYEKIEKKKQKIFLEGEYDLIDELNDELLKIMKRFEKLEILIQK